MWLTSQSLGNGSLTGKYNFRHVLLTTDANGQVSQAQSLAGSATFDGAGKYTFQGQQTTGATGAAALTGSGVYAVQPSGLFTMTNPQNAVLNINGRLGAGLLLGSSTEAPAVSATTLDLFVAIPAPPANAVSTATLNGTYQVATLEFPGGAAAQVRSTAFNWVSNGLGSLGNPNVVGHAANFSPGVINQTVNGATYTLAADGTGTASFGASNANQLLSGTRTIYISADGNIVIGGTTTAGGHDFLIAVKALSGTATAGSLTGYFYTAGLAFGALSAYAGSSNSPGAGSILFNRRYHAPGTAIDFTGVMPYTMNPDGTGVSQQLRIAVGAAGKAFFAAGIGDFDAANFELDLAIQAPPITGSGVYVSPLGVVNAGSLSPVGSAVAPGEYLGIFGTGLAAAAASPSGLPLPLTLGNVQVLINNTAAPLNYVGPNQINALVPFATPVGTATVTVRNNGVNSNVVTVPVAATAPGIFSQSGTSIGAGAIIHPADGSLVNAAKPASRGEIVSIYLTGLGAVTPAVADGAAAGASRTVAQPYVLVGGKVATVQYSGTAPTFAGLYQINIFIPSDAPLGSNIALAIGTNDAFNDQVDIAIR